MRIRRSTMLSATVTYALRALIELSRTPPGAAMSGRDLAETTAIPRNYLAKVLGALRTARILSAVRGIGGGYRLLEDPAQIRIADVVRLFEGPALSPRCVLQGDRPCSGREPCAAHELWAEVSERYVGFLETTTVAALATGPGGWRMGGSVGAAPKDDHKTTTSAARGSDRARAGRPVTRPRASRTKGDTR